MTKVLNSSQLLFCEKQKKRALECRINYKNNPKKCTQCGKKISFQRRENKFCSQSCSATFNNTSRKKYRVDNNGKIIDYKFCLGCGKKLEKYDIKFCNAACNELYYTNKFKEYIEKTGKYPTTKYGHSKNSKKYLIKINGHQCSICHRKRWRGQLIPLIFDHIDGNNSNWKIDNCRLICSNCDHQQPTFAGKNIKNKHNSLKSLRRKRRYKEEKKKHNKGFKISY
jgi:predicted nucleic acid-binding Zn ribbon protein